VTSDPLVDMVGSCDFLKFWEISDISKIVQDEDIVTVEDK